MEPEPVDTLRGLMDARTITTLLDVSERTARRWAAEGIPPQWQRLADIVLQGDLAAIHRPWLGWKIDAEAIYSPDGWRFSRGELTAIPWEYQRLRALSGDVVKLRAELATRAQLRLI